MRTFGHSTRLFDMHCHLGFVDEPEKVRDCLAETGAAALSCTVLPAEYVRESEAFADAPGCTVALGLHPWQVATEEAHDDAVERFAELARTTRFIGEVGLDYAGDRGEDAARTRQRKAFAQVIAACDAPSSFPRKLISLHAVHAAGDVLDALEEHDALARHDCIFHWFSGTSEELTRAVHAGCLFSVGPRMLATKRGREYARIVPVDSLLLETDSPSTPHGTWSCEGWWSDLMGALSALATIRNVPEEELARTIARTSAALLTQA